jgi:hypothetical protein
MAKKLDLFKKTEGDLDQGNIKAIGVGLREAEIAILDDIGAELGRFMDAAAVARNSVMRIAIRRFIVDYQAGEIPLDELAAYFDRPDKPQPKLRF